MTWGGCGNDGGRWVYGLGVVELGVIHADRLCGTHARRVLTSFGGGAMVGFRIRLYSRNN